MNDATALRHYTKYLIKYTCFDPRWINVIYDHCNNYLCSILGILLLLGHWFWYFIPKSLYSYAILIYFNFVFLSKRKGRFYEICCDQSRVYLVNYSRVKYTFVCTSLINKWFAYQWILIRLWMKAISRNTKTSSSSAVF